MPPSTTTEQTPKTMGAPILKAPALQPQEKYVYVLYEGQSPILDSDGNEIVFDTISDAALSKRRDFNNSPTVTIQRKNRVK